MTSKTLTYGQDARLAITQGAVQTADAVAVTMGPKGRTVIIQQSFGTPKITKDGATVAKSISFDDPETNLGAQAVMNVATMSNKGAGDGTTTGSVITKALLVKALKATAADMNVMDLKRGMDSACKALIDELKKISRPCKEI